MTGANIANTGWVTCLYDGKGRRVQKTVGGDATYVYDAAGQLAAEYSTGGSTAAGTQYLTGDALGSTRLVANGATIQLYDYLPFGEDIPRGVGGRGTQYPTGVYPGGPDTQASKFTGKERDSETGLDFFGARYFSAAQGRFTSPDPIMVTKDRLADPQRLNLYGYTRNNPLRFVDPNGEDFIVYTFYSRDLTDEQRKYLQANMKQIQAEVRQKYKDAGVDKVEFRDGSGLTQKQINALLQMERSTDTTGIGLLNFANKSFAGNPAPSEMLGATSSDSRSVVFMGNVAQGLKSDDTADLTFRLGEVASHELGHGQGFESDSSFTNFFKELVGRGNLMGEGQGLPTRPKAFDATQDKTQRAIREINRVGDNTPKP